MIEIPDQTYIDLYESSEMYKSLVETSPDAVTATDLEGRITVVSKRTLELHGFKDEKEILGKSAFEMIAPEDHEKATTNLKRTLTEGSIRNIEYTLLRKDGSRFIGELNASLIKDASGKPKAFIATTRDISWRKQAEKALRESEERYRHLFEKSPVGVGLASLDGKIIACNKTMEKITGYSLKEFKKIKLVDTYEKPEHRKALIEIVKRDGGVVNYPVRLRRKNGTPYDALLNIQRIHLDNEELLQTICIDITEHRLMEKALRESERLYKTLAESSQDFIFIIDANGKFEYVNSFTARHLRCRPEEIIGKSLEEFFPPNVVERQKWNIQKVFDSGESFTFEESITFPGRMLWSDTRLIPIKDKEGRVKSILGISRDMTRYKRVEDELREKLGELKEFTDQVVGRELKLIELEKEIIRLKEKITQDKESSK